SDAPMVFAGFGIVAPEYDWNDYKDLDAEGKVVVVLVNDPGFQSGNPHLFKGDTMTYYGRWTYKYEEAARQGAAGVLFVYQFKPACYPWSVVLCSCIAVQLYLQAADKLVDRCGMEGLIPHDVALMLLAQAGINCFFSELARKRSFKAIPLHQRLSVTFTNH